MSILRAILDRIRETFSRVPCSRSQAWRELNYRHRPVTK